MANNIAIKVPQFNVFDWHPVFWRALSKKSRTVERARFEGYHNSRILGHFSGPKAMSRHLWWQGTLHYMPEHGKFICPHAVYSSISVKCIQD